MLTAPPPPLPVHEELRRIIADRGHTLDTAAGELGCSSSYLRKVLRGEYVPTDPLRMRAERVYGVAFVRWDPRSLDRSELIRQGFRPGSLARKLGLPPSKVLAWWRGGDVADVACAVFVLLGGKP